MAQGLGTEDVERAGGTRGEIKTPPRDFLDTAARWLRTSHAIRRVAVGLWDSVLPLLLAVFVVAPLSALILPFFVPKFLRNARRRRTYEVIPSFEQRKRPLAQRPSYQSDIAPPPLSQPGTNAAQPGSETNWPDLFR
jgi:hypothetical protein